MKIVLVALGIMSLNAYADISGKWIGQGDWKYQGSGDHCYMNLNFEDNSKTLIRHTSNFECSVVGLEVIEAEFKKDGTKLLNSDGTVVGNYVNNIITLNEDYDENVKIITTMKVDGLHMDYSEKWIEKDGSELYDITGRLFTNK